MAPKYQYYVGVYYPQKLSDNGVPGYILSPSSLRVVAEKLVGCPITFEHAGIEQAAEKLGSKPSSTAVIQALQTQSKKTNDLTQRPVSVISDAYQNANGEWLCVFAIDVNLFPRLVAMICGGSLTGLSLSHFESSAGAPPVPLEVSLCQQPARPGCYMRAVALPSLTAVKLYKAFDLSMAQSERRHLCTMSADNTSKSAPATAAADNDIHTALEAMTEKQRSLVSAALDSMQKRITAAEKSAKEATEENEVMKNAAAIDKQLLRSQIESFMTFIGEDNSRKFGITTKSLNDQLLNSDSPDHMRRCVDRMLMCCNSHLMAKHSTPAPPAASMMSVDDDVAVPVAASTSVGGKRKAEADEPVDTDAASVLRNALKKF